MAVALKITGLRENIRAMERAGVETEDLKEGFGQVGDKVVTVARRYTPNRTGALAGTVRRSNRKNGVVVSAGGGRVDYHWYVYRGSIHNSPPIPFIKLAVGALGDEIERMVDSAVNTALRRAGL
jgi:hypothetical protein